MLCEKEKENIILNFPDIKLSYENIIHKKVYNYDYLVAIPEGKKCFIWFTTINNVIVCLIMKLHNKKIINIKRVNTCFSPDLSYGIGTILYGTLIYYLNNMLFCSEDIYFYKGNELDKTTWNNKLEIMYLLLKKELNKLSKQNSIVFGLPLMSSNNEDFEHKLKNIKYKIMNIQFKILNKVNTCLYMNYENYIKIKTCDLKKAPTCILEKPFINKEFVFVVRPDIKDDIYYLYCLNNELKEEQYSIANIPDYTTSVMMNKLFRIIKENDNLDKLEESDTEEEFENDKMDKYVYLNKSYKMSCVYNTTFNKWTPIQLSDNEIIKNDELKHIYKL